MQRKGVNKLQVIEGGAGRCIRYQHPFRIKLDIVIMPQGRHSNDNDPRDWRVSMVYSHPVLLEELSHQIALELTRYLKSMGAGDLRHLRFADLEKIAAASGF